MDVIVTAFGEFIWASS